MNGKVTQIDSTAGKWVLHFTAVDGHQYAHPIDANCHVTVNGTAARYDDLAVDDEVEVSGNPATSVVATRKAAFVAPTFRPPVRTSAQPPAPKPPTFPPLGGQSDRD